MQRARRSRSEALGRRAAAPSGAVPPRCSRPRPEEPLLSESAEVLLILPVICACGAQRRAA